MSRLTFFLGFDINHSIIVFCILLEELYATNITEGLQASANGEELIANMMTKTESMIAEEVQNHPKQLSNGMLILLIALLASFPPLSTDLYWPALPTMSEQLVLVIYLSALAVRLQAFTAGAAG